MPVYKPYKFIFPLLLSTTLSTTSFVSRKNSLPSHTLLRITSLSKPTGVSVTYEIQGAHVVLEKINNKSPLVIHLIAQAILLYCMGCWNTQGPGRLFQGGRMGSTLICIFAPQKYPYSRKSVARSTLKPHTSSQLPISLRCGALRCKEHLYFLKSSLGRSSRARNIPKAHFSMRCMLWVFSNPAP